MPTHPISTTQVEHDLSLRDLTDPSAGPHAIQILIARAIEVLRDRWHCDIRWCRGERVVTIENNYNCLGFDPTDVTRDARYTRYVDENHVLRSHSSAMIPPALRALAENPVDDVLLVCPGVVFRRDSIDRLHTGTPHQLDLWRVTQQPMTDDDMDEMINVIVRTLVPGRRYRTEARVHPYTLHGRQVDVDNGGEWIEVWECGLTHPHVLANAGLDDSFSGLALGMGLDRLLMLVKQIPDIRVLRSADPRIAAQMLTLEPYQEVSSMPAIRRDLSVAVDPGDVAEDLGDRVREALGADAASVESVEVLSETSCSQLPPQALERLGARPDQKNLLVRVVLRDLERTLTDAEGNGLRDRIYEAMHRGSNYQWADRPPRPS